MSFVDSLLLAIHTQNKWLCNNYLEICSFKFVHFEKIV